MLRIELKQIFLELEREIAKMNNYSVPELKENAKQDARAAIVRLKPDIDIWAVKLSNHEITCYDLEEIIAKREDCIKFNYLDPANLPEECSDNINKCMMKVITKSITNSLLASLYRDHKTQHVS